MKVQSVGQAHVRKVQDHSSRRGHVMVICENPKHKQKQG